MNWKKYKIGDVTINLYAVTSYYMTDLQALIIDTFNKTYTFNATNVESVEQSYQDLDAAISAIES